jgi:hypothetical protein
MITEEEEEIIENYMNNKITNVTEDELELINQYYNSLDDNDVIAMYVAINVLESSFDIKKSQGYLKWKVKNVK